MRSDSKPSHFICIHLERILLFRVLRELSERIYFANYGLKAIFKNENGTLSRRHLIVTTDAYLRYFKQHFKEYGIRYGLEVLLRGVEVDFPALAEENLELPSLNGGSADVS